MDFRYDVSKDYIISPSNATRCHCYQIRSFFSRSFVIPRAGVLPLLWIVASPFGVSRTVLLLSRVTVLDKILFLQMA